MKAFLLFAGQNSIHGGQHKLSDQELDQLSAAVLVEQQRRGKKPPSNENAQVRLYRERDEADATAYLQAK
jgi:hypothetical protein